MLLTAGPLFFFFPGVTTESCFLFNLPESSTNRRLHTLLLRDPQKAKKAPTLQMLQLAAAITCEKNKINAFCMRRKNAKQTARLSRKLYDFNNRFSTPPPLSRPLRPSHLHAESLCVQRANLLLPTAFNAFL